VFTGSVFLSLFLSVVLCILYFSFLSEIISLHQPSSSLPKRGLKMREKLREKNNSKKNRKRKY
jgi:Na+-driven multidrug efflux pump